MRTFLLALVLVGFSFDLAHAVPENLGLVDLKGTPTVAKHDKNKELVVFWSTTCRDCKAKLRDVLPALNNREDLAVLTVNTNRDRDRALAYVEKNEIRLPVLQDPEKKLRRSLKVFAVPHWAAYQRENPQSEWKLVRSEPSFNLDQIKEALQLD